MSLSETFLLYSRHFSVAVTRFPLPKHGPTFVVVGVVVDDDVVCFVVVVVVVVVVGIVDAVDSQRQQAEERANKMKSVLVKTKRELAETKKEVGCENTTNVQTRKQANNKQRYKRKDCLLKSPLPSPWVVPGGRQR